jgi:hypothetical protein
MSVSRIEVTLHAVEQLQSRCPDVPYADETTIRLEVAAAFRDGRVAVNTPRFLGRRRRSRAPSTRFAWRESEGRAYVLKKQIAGVKVLTVVVPRTFA